MRYTVVNKYCLWMWVSICFAGCAKQVPQEMASVPNENHSMVLQFDGVVQPFDATKAPEEFIPSSANLIYLSLISKDWDHFLTGKCRFNENDATWFFSYEGSTDGLTTGDVYGYLFENNWNQYNYGAEEYIQLGPKVPVYETTEGSFRFEKDTLFIQALFSPATSRVIFTQDLADGRSREVQNITGLRYCSRFYPASFIIQTSAEEFYGGSANNSTFYYGNALYPQAPVLQYYFDSYYYIKRFPASAFQPGETGSVYLPQNSSSYEGWEKHRWLYEWYISGTRYTTFRFVSCGGFDMGGPDAQPIHPVTISDSFYMMNTEVDQALWYDVMGEPAEYQYQQIPVTGKSWEEIQVFIAKMGLKYKCHLRLPTEAEWEYAARGGLYELTRNQFYSYSGSDTIDEVAWYSGNSEASIHTLQGLGSNALNLNDMSGNVAELCSDWYGDYTDQPVQDPRGPETGTAHVVRGGSYTKDATWCTNTHRGSEADYDPSEVGFRLVLISPSFPD